MNDQPCLQATLQDLPLADWIRFAPVRAESGVLTINNEDEAGLIYFREGNAIHAEVGTSSSGVDAVYELLNWVEGEIIFQSLSSLPNETIELSNVVLILEGSRLIKEWSLIEQTIPADAETYQFVFSSAPAGTEFTEEEQRILRHLKQSSSVDGLQSDLGISTIGLKKALLPLVASGIVTMQKTPREFIITSVNQQSNLTPDVFSHIHHRLEKLQPEFASV